MGGDSTLTAASLIDAIITHQINQTSNPNELGGPGGASSNSKSAVDSLFNRYRRSPLPPDPRPPPPTTSASASVKGEQQRTHPAEGESGAQQLPPQRPPSSSPSVVTQPPAAPTTNKSAFTLGEHIESIIAKDFHQGAAHGPPSGTGGGSSSGGAQGGTAGPAAAPTNDQDWDRDWQRRQAESFKSRMTASSAADPSMISAINDYANRSAATAAAMEFAAKCRAAESQQGQPPSADARGAEPDPRQPAISPLDYVKKKIVEVMRTNSGEGQQQQQDMAPPSSPARRCLSPAPSPNKRPRLNADGGGEGDQQQPPQPPPPASSQAQQQQQRGGPSPVVPHYLSGAPYPTMGYPYSIPPNVPITNASSVAGTAPTGHQQSVVVLSSQYEALSDDDEQ